MAKPFDVTLKELMENYPADWVRLAGITNPGKVEVVDADLSTVSAEADKVFVVGNDPRWILHLEPQSSYEANLGQRIFRYNAMLDYRHNLPVQSVALLLRPEADGPQISGLYRRQLPGGRKYLFFRYRVIRMWEIPPNVLLHSGLGILPLAPIGDVSPQHVPDVIREMKRRISAEAAPPVAAALWASTYLLMGLRYSAEFAETVLRGVRNMKESTTYQAILSEGRVEGRVEGRAEGVTSLREVLIVLGTRRLGSPGSKAQAIIDTLTDLNELKRLAERVMDVENWDELLGGR